MADSRPNPMKNPLAVVGTGGKKPNALATGAQGPAGPQGPTTGTSAAPVPNTPLGAPGHRVLSGGVTPPGSKPSNADIRAGMAFGNAVLGGGGGDGGYGAAFQAAIGSSRSSIQQQMQAALDEISRQEQTGTQEVNTLPGTYDTITGDTTKQITNSANAAQQAQLQSGLQSFTPAGTTSQPMIDAANQANGFLKGGVPLLQLGVQDTANRQRGAARQTGMEMNAALDQEQRQYEQQRSMAELQRQDDTKMKLLDLALGQKNDDKQFAQQKELAQMGYAHDDKQFGQQLTLSQLQKDQARQDDESDQLRAGGLPITGQQADTLRKSSLYNELVSWMQSNPDKDTSDWVKTKIGGAKGRSGGFGIGPLTYQGPGSGATNYDTTGEAGPGLTDFLNKLVGLAEWDMSPKLSTGSVKTTTAP